MKLYNTIILSLFLNACYISSQPLCSEKQTCNTLQFDGIVWDSNDEMGIGLKVGPFTDNQLQWLGCIGTNPACQFFCSQTDTSMTFGANFVDGNNPRMTALLGDNFPSVDTSLSCSDAGDIDKQSAAFIDAVSAQKLCEQLGYSTGIINKCNTASGCDYVKYDTGSSTWTLDVDENGKTLEQMTCSGCIEDSSSSSDNKQIVVNVNNYIYNNGDDKCCSSSSDKSIKSKSSSKLIKDIVLSPFRSQKKKKKVVVVAVVIVKLHIQ